ncbi:hypothetical protein F4782DRAFT_503727 [Xylaria castorea]|nr:hypothetical protein F4782DRAFT_503727 [Xylaria castorea]
MYAFGGGRDLSHGKPTLLTQLAWREVPLSDKTELQEIQALFQELGISVGESNDPTLHEVLSHESMANVWGTPPMTLHSAKAIQDKEGHAPTVRTLKRGLDSWKLDMLLLKGHHVVGERLSRHFDHRSARGTLQVLCNFPPFIRVHYQADNADSRKSQSFAGLRYFRLRAPGLVNETDRTEQEHIYVLIACYFNPDEKAKVGELRLYSDRGRPIVPGNEPPFGGQHLYDPSSERRLSDPGIDCILLYGRTKSSEEDLFCSELALKTRREGYLLGAREYTRQLVRRELTGPSVTSSVLQEHPEVISTRNTVKVEPLHVLTEFSTSHQQSVATVVSTMPNFEFGSSSQTGGNIQNQQAANRSPDSSEFRQRHGNKRPHSGDHYEPSPEHRSQRPRVCQGVQGYSGRMRQKSPLDLRETVPTKREPSAELCITPQPQAREPRGKYNPLGSQEDAFQAFMGNQ